MCTNTLEMRKNLQNGVSSVISSSFHAQSNLFIGIKLSTMCSFHVYYTLCILLLLYFFSSQVLFWTPNSCLNVQLFEEVLVRASSGSGTYISTQARCQLGDTVFPA